MPKLALSPAIRFLNIFSRTLNLNFLLMILILNLPLEGWESFSLMNI